jgi:hypothetical protein
MTRDPPGTAARPSDLDRVVMIWQTLFKSGFDQLHVSPDGYMDWKQQARSLRQLRRRSSSPNTA